MREKLTMKTIDLCEVSNIPTVVAVVRKAVVAALHAEVGVAAIIAIVRQ